MKPKLWRYVEKIFKRGADAPARPDSFDPLSDWLHEAEPTRLTVPEPPPIAPDAPPPADTTAPHQLHEQPAMFDDRTPLHPDDRWFFNFSPEPKLERAVGAAGPLEDPRGRVKNPPTPANDPLAALAPLTSAMPGEISWLAHPEAPSPDRASNLESPTPAATPDAPSYGAPPQPLLPATTSNEQPASEGFMPRPILAAPPARPVQQEFFPPPLFETAREPTLPTVQPAEIAASVKPPEALSARAALDWFSEIAQLAAQEAETASDLASCTERLEPPGLGAEDLTREAGSAEQVEPFDFEAGIAEAWLEACSGLAADAGAAGNDALSDRAALRPEAVEAVAPVETVLAAGSVTPASAPTGGTAAVLALPTDASAAWFDEPSVPTRPPATADHSDDWWSEAPTVTQPAKPGEPTAQPLLKRAPRAKLQPLLVIDREDDEGYRAPARAAMLFDKLDVAQVSRRRDVLDELIEILNAFPRGASHKAIERLADQSVSFETLRGAAKLKQAWREDSSLWLVRRWSGPERRSLPKIDARNGRNALSWLTACKLAEALDPDEALEHAREAWRTAWFKLQPYDPGYLSFAKYLDARAESLNEENIEDALCHWANDGDMDESYDPFGWKAWLDPDMKFALQTDWRSLGDLQPSRNPGTLFPEELAHVSR